uniref:Uncharacterized protein n=1 Tax=Cacopsylla melanoneura TaxID=428564 RepID=A0A8D8ZAY8_9HEMI
MWQIDSGKMTLVNYFPLCTSPMSVSIDNGFVVCCHGITIILRSPIVSDQVLYCALLFFFLKFMHGSCVLLLSTIVFTLAEENWLIESWITIFHCCIFIWLKKLAYEFQPALLSPRCFMLLPSDHLNNTIIKYFMLTG